MLIDNFDAVIFDMDGTLVDSLGIWSRIDYEFLEKKRGIKVPEDYARGISAMSFAEIAEYTIARFNLNDTPEALMQEWTDMAICEYSSNIKLKEGVREYIAQLGKKGMKMALCTSSPQYFYEPAMKNNGIYESFCAFTTTCEAGEGKNTPKVFLLAAEKAGASPSKCLVFEDTLSAAKSAKKAGMTVCGVFDERNKDFEEALIKECDFYIRSFSELLEE